MQPNKTIKIFLNYFLGPLLFIWLGFSIYQQIIHQPRLEQSWEEIKQSFFSSRVVLLVATVLLIPINWGVEAWKWKLLIHPIRDLSFYGCFKAVLSGVSISVTMPNRIGEYVGRMMYMPEGSRLRTIAAAVVGSIAQLIVTLFCGLVALAFLKKNLITAYPNLIIWYQFAFYGLLTILLIIVLLYFNVERFVTIIRKWVGGSKYLYLIDAWSSYTTKFLLQMVLISGLRYTVFLSQYLLVFHLFQLDVSIANMIGTTSVLFLAMAMIPSIALVEIGLRGEVSLRLMGLFTANTLAVGLTTVTIWFLNLIVPAIIGSLLLLNVKLLKKNENT